VENENKVRRKVADKQKGKLAGIRRCIRKKRRGGETEEKRHARGRRWPRRGTKKGKNRQGEKANKKGGGVVTERSRRLFI